MMINNKQGGVKMNMFSDNATITFNWLNKDRAQGITAICKSAGEVTVKRVAQERGVLGVMKLIVTVYGHSWKNALDIVNSIRRVVNEAGLSDGETY